MTNLLDTTYTPADLLEDLAYLDGMCSDDMPDGADADECDVLARIDAGETNVLEHLVANKEKKQIMLIDAYYPELPEDMVTDQPVKDRQRKPRKTDGPMAKLPKWLDDTFDEARRRKLLDRIAERDVTEGVIATMFGEDSQDGGDDGGDHFIDDYIDEEMTFIPWISFKYLAGSTLVCPDDMPDGDDEMEILALLDHVNEAEVLARIDAGETNVLERFAAEQAEQSEPAEDMITDQPEKDRQRKPRETDGRMLNLPKCYHTRFNGTRRRNLIARNAERDVTEGVITTMFGDDDDDGGDEVSNTIAIATLEDGVRFLPCGAALCRAA